MSSPPFLSQNKIFVGSPDPKLILTSDEKKSLDCPPVLVSLGKKSRSPRCLDPHPEYHPVKSPVLVVLAALWSSRLLLEKAWYYLFTESLDISLWELLTLHQVLDPSLHIAHISQGRHGWLLGVEEKLESRFKYLYTKCMEEEYYVLVLGATQSDMVRWKKSRGRMDERKRRKKGQFAKQVTFFMTIPSKTIGAHPSSITCDNMPSKANRCTIFRASLDS